MRLKGYNLNEVDQFRAALVVELGRYKPLWTPPSLKSPASECKRRNGKGLGNPRLTESDS